VPERLRSLLVFNPLAGLVGLYRAALLGGPAPPVASLAALVIAALVAMGLGWWAFRRFEPAFVDEL
jgi:lipopolysaccharide transport system permease protein